MKNLVLNGQRLHLNEKLEGFNFLTVGQVLQKARAQENRANESRDTYQMNQSHVNMIENKSDLDEVADVYTIEFVWPKAKPYTCSDPKPVRKSHVKEFK
jgi:hypothetical protein